MKNPEDNAAGKDRFASFCVVLDKLGGRFGISSIGERAAAKRSDRTKVVHDLTSNAAPRKRTNRDKLEELGYILDLTETHLEPEAVVSAGKSFYVLMSIILFCMTTAAFFVFGLGYAIISLLAVVVVPPLARSALMAYPFRRAASRAAEVLRTSSEPVNLMIMSLRHEPSVSKAIAFASGKECEFTRELRNCIWGVIMGRFASFEEALLSVGQRWSRYGSELKTSLNAMVTASRESTEDGKRRALDRANTALVSGARRRIEEYSMSLSTPSMMLFGLGILLPLMVGSFLPMLSWNLWSTEGFAGVPGAGRSDQITLEMVFIMNVLFPAIASLIALNALSGHPLNIDAGPKKTKRLHRSYEALVVVAASTLGVALELGYLPEGTRPAGLLLSGVVPVGIWTLFSGIRATDRSKDKIDGLEDALFKTGARMLEGENFESSLSASCRDVGKSESELVRRVTIGTIIMGQEDEPVPGSRPFGYSNAIGGLRIARLAAQKDELAAGLLAMDLAAYLKDLRDLDVALKNKLKPTISMMRTTSLVLAPIVLGVTYAIYLSLGSMIGGGGGVGQEQFFLVLGLFLAEMDIIVVYFAWGIEGQKKSGALMSSLGLCLLVSEGVFVSTALLASA